MTDKAERREAYRLEALRSLASLDDEVRRLIERHDPYEIYNNVRKLRSMIGHLDHSVSEFVRLS